MQNPRVWSRDQKQDLCFNRLEMISWLFRSFKSWVEALENAFSGFVLLRTALHHHPNVQKKNFFSCNYSYKVCEENKEMLRKGRRKNAVVLPVSRVTNGCWPFLLAKCCSRFITDPALPGSRWWIPVQLMQGWGFHSPAATLRGASLPKAAKTRSADMECVGWDFVLPVSWGKTAMLGLLFPLLRIPKGLLRLWFLTGFCFYNIQLLFL